MRLIIAGGGTGGHLYPGIAVAQELLSRDGDHKVLFAGSASGIEARVLPKLGYSFAPISAGGLVGKGPLKKAAGAAKLAKGFFEATSITLGWKPDICLGVGGYASFPVVAQCAFTGVATAIQEQNAKAGFANRVLGRMAKRIYLGDRAAGGEFQREKCLFTGNPLRKEFLKKSEYALPGSGEPLKILVLGGSQGSATINRAVPEALKGIDLPVEVIHQCGRSKEGSIKEAYGNKEGVTVVPFIEDMVESYLWAHLVIARAGALTLAELSAMGRPSILIPFPQAAGNHQERNALEAQKRGAARCITERELTTELLTGAIEDFAKSPGDLKKSSRSAYKAAPTKAAKMIVDDLMALTASRR